METCVPEPHPGPLTSEPSTSWDLAVAGDLAPWPTLTAPITIAEGREGPFMNILSSAAPSEHLRWFPQILALQETKDADSFQGYTTCK